ncbi:DUF262 domain-containing protein [uncultured Sphingomonas sp.]|uniref:DUF262 domain-containing protein n=1 Tax=uncultured Sphingomonas sp. TaxID=158754 RepID=UPI0025FF8F60|nr:DUF262 domain-containing protein [uncultured Sphingomonas sp.]
MTDLFEEELAAERRRRAQSLGEDQIRAHMRDVDYSIREYPIEVLVPMYLDGAEEGTNEIFIPDYQRSFVWGLKQQSRFIESAMIGLPIPYLFVADVGNENEELSGRLEIVDGTQRIRTLAAYLTGQLRLEQLTKLTELNGTVIDDLLPSRYRRFRRTTIRLIELTERADEEMRRDMFDRINSGGEPLNPMEVRRGVLKGEFLGFVAGLAADQRLREIAPLSAASVKRRDYDELVVRFFAYTERYNEFERSVIDFIDEYISSKSEFDAGRDGPPMAAEWYRMLDFVETNFQYGFKKALRNTRIPRVRFEAISVGVALALRAQPDLQVDPARVAEWAYGPEFTKLVTSDGANSRPRIAARIEFVRNQLLKSL